MRLPSNQNQTMQRLAQINLTQLLQRPRRHPLVFSPDPRNTHSKIPSSTNPLPLFPLNLYHLTRALRNRHEPRRLIDLPPPGHVHQRLLFHLDIQQHKRMQPN